MIKLIGEAVHHSGCDRQPMLLQDGRGRFDAEEEAFVVDAFYPGVSMVSKFIQIVKSRISIETFE